MEFKIINDIETLIKMRMTYLRYDFPDTSEEELAKIAAVLPEYFKKHIDRDMFAFAAVEDGTVISGAFLVVIEKPANPAFPTGKVGNVLNVFTLEQYRRKGIAARVMKMLIEYAEKIKLDFLELKATSDGYPLYKKLGFSEETSSYTAMKFYF